MKYVMLFHEAPGGFAQRTDPSGAEAYWGGWNAYMQALGEAGVMVGGNGLEPPHATTSLTLRDGRRHVQDGPFADTKEQLGGYVVIEVADLDAALDWAARAPCAAEGGVELRPVMGPPPPA